MLNKENLRIGQRIQVSCWGAGFRYGTINNIEYDIKNGRPGVDYTGDNGEGYWCYLDQIVGASQCQ